MKALYLVELGRITVELKETIVSQSQVFDAVALDATSRYSLVLKDEMRLAEEKLFVEKYEKEFSKKLVQTIKNIQVFNCHLQLESKREIELLLLPHSSQQYQRCMKAVLDNLGGQNHFQNHSSMYMPAVEDDQGGIKLRYNILYQTLTSQNLKVTNIFKLKNTHLSERLQVS